MRSLVLVLTLAISARVHARPVTVYLEREGDDRVSAFEGSTRVWRAVVACVQDQYAPFRVDVVDRRPRRGKHVTVVFGGRPAQLGLDDPTISGDSPYTGRVMPNAVVHVFSEVTGNNVAELCETAAHEVGHALGLDHELDCHDLMSSAKRCGTPTFVDDAEPCGEHRKRTCDNGDRRQNSYRRLAELVGLR